MRIELMYTDFGADSMVTPSYAIHIDGEAVNGHLSAVKDPLTEVLRFDIDIPDLATYEPAIAFVVGRNTRVGLATTDASVGETVQFVPDVEGFVPDDGSPVLAGDGEN